MNAKIEAPSARSRAQSWNAVMTASPGDLDLTIASERIEGTIPLALRGGRVLSNGPGWTRIGDRTAHPFDGHGYLRAFSLQEDGSCRLRARFVQTRVYRDETKAGALVHRGFATNVRPGLRANLRFGVPRNVANTTIVRWGGQLLAGWEGGAPHALDPDSLETKGVQTFGGAIEGVPTLAHMKHDAATDRLVLCSPSMGRSTSFTVREVDRDGQVTSTYGATMDGMCFAHDFAITPRYVVLGGNPLRLRYGRLAAMLVGRSTLLESIATDDDRPGVLHLLPRDGSPLRTVTLPSRALVVHFADAFERDGTVVVDACVFDRFEFGEELGYQGPDLPFDPALPDARGPQTLVRITIPEGATEASWEPLCEHGVDFPRFHPAHEGQPTPQLLGATRADTRYSDPFDSVIRIDLEDLERPPSLWTVPPQGFVGEPLLAPDPARDDAGHVIVMSYDGLREQSWLNVLDASRLEAGPVARIPLPLMPMAFHGDWEPGPNG